MTCKYVAPNGKPSQLFDDVYQSTGLDNAVKVFNKVQSPDFKSWYGEGTMVNDEPVITNGMFTNSEGKKMLVNEINQFEDSDIQGKVDFMKAKFEAIGVPIEVSSDNTISEAGYIINVNGKVQIKLNESKIEGDTVFHEFGHAYVDLLGESHPLVIKGIKELRNTPLWNTIAQRYPELNRGQLGKEVLTTAIGIEAARMYDPLAMMLYPNSSFSDKIQFYIKRIIRAISEMLGKDKKVAARLAYDLTGGRMRNRLTGKVSSYKQASKSSKPIEEKIADLEKKSDNIVLTDDEKHYTLVDDKSQRLVRTTNFISQLKHAFDREGAIAKVASSTKRIYAKYNTDAEVRKLWEDKREGGTGIHLLAEIYIDATKDGMTREQAREKVLTNLHDTGKGGTFDEEGVARYGGMKREFVEPYIDNIIDFIENLRTEGYTLFTEIQVASLGIGVAGTIDLLAVKDGKVHIFDFKTKEAIVDGQLVVSKFDSFNKKEVFMKDGVNERGFLDYMVDVDPTKANEYSMQLSLYKLMLEELGLEVGELHIVPLTGEMVKDDDGDYQYKDLKIYKPPTGIKVGNYTGLGTFKLNDLSQIMYDGINGKPNLQANVNQTASQIAAINASTEDADKERLALWIKETKLDLEKDIARVSARALNRKSALAHKQSLTELIEKMGSVDEIEALSSYAKYVKDEVARMEYRLGGEPSYLPNGLFDVTKGGYSKITWNDIKRLEAENFAGYNSFVGWLINADSFLNQIVKVEELEYLTEQIDDEGKKVLNDIIKELKSNESKVSNMTNKIAGVNREFDLRYLELSRNPLFAGKNVADVLNEFFKAQVDESFFQRNLDALADTHHMYMANVMKMYQIHMHDARKETERLQKDFEKVTEGHDLSKMVKDGKLVEAIDRDAYYQAKAKMEVDANGIADANLRKAFIKKWYKDNTEPLTTKERKDLIKRKKEFLTDTEHANWVIAQQFDGTINTASGKKRSKVDSNRGAFYKPKASLYTSREYSLLSEEEIKVLNYIRNMFMMGVDHVKGNAIVRNGYIPAIPFDEKELAKQFQTNMGWHDSHVQNEESLIDANGEIVQVLPFRFNSLLHQKDLPGYPEDATAEQKLEITKQRQIVIMNNRKAHAASISQDLTKVVPMFLETAIKHKYKKSVESELHRVKKSLIENHKIKVTKNGKVLKDYHKGKHGFTDNSVEKTSKDSKLLAHYEDWLKMIFYENFENDEGDLTKLARVLQNYTSLKGMALNLPSAINNVTYGQLMSNIEAHASEFFGHGAWLKAGKQYGGNLGAIMNSNKDNKANSFLSEFDIMMDYKEQGVGASPTASAGHRVMNALGKAVSASYFMTSASEHYLQNRLLLAMSNSHRIIDGRIYSEQDYMRGKLEVVDAYGDKGVAKDVIARNKEKRKALLEEFKKGPTVYEAYDNTIEGDHKYSVPINKDELATFENRVLGVNQYIHGIYNKEDAGTMQKYALGRLAIQFRKWMRPGWNKRWGTKAGTTFWNERRQAYDEGYYQTTIKFLASPWSKAREEQKAREETQDQMDTMEFFGKMLSNYGSFIRNAKIHWNSMEDWQKSGVIRTVTEYAFLCTAIGVGYALKSMKGEDDDPPLPLMMALYQADRTIVELTTYVPMAVAPGFAGGGFMNEAKKILKSPTATFNSVENLYKLSKSIAMHPFNDDEENVYKGGVYHGQDKVMVQAVKNVPFINQWYRIENLSKNYKYYKLF